MEKVIGISVLNPCYYCCCYDPDYGCTMPPYDLCYACPYSPDLTMEDSENIKGE